jgi:MEMO1 family protein
MKSEIRNPKSEGSSKPEVRPTSAELRRGENPRPEVPRPQSGVRQAVFSGRFYPSDPAELLAEVNRCLSAAAPVAGPPPKAIIAPHAGYVYSGLIAGSAYAQFVPLRGEVRRIVLLGPSHYVAFAGLAATSACGFATPLGIVPANRETMGQTAKLPQVKILDAAHANEHALEVQLPFLQVALDEFSLIALAVGEATSEEICQVIESLWGGPETRFVISSDLSHFHDSETARKMDTAAARAIEELDPERLGEDQACGRAPISGLLLAARRRGLHARTLDLRNSSDTAGPRERVVGYGAFAFG